MRATAPVLIHGNTKHFLHAVPAGDAGIRATLRIMRELVRSWRKHPQIRNLAKQITRGCPPKGYGCEAKKLHTWVRDKVRYIRDVHEVETVQAPDVTLRDGSGDCDDQVVLLGSLLNSIGHPVRFVAVGFRPGGPFTHVYLETRLGAYWVAAETTEKWALGMRPPGVCRYTVQKV